MTASEIPPTSSSPVRFQGRRLATADLRGRSLVASRIVDCDLRGLDLSGIDLRDSIVRMSNLERLPARGCTAQAAHLEDCRADGADLTGALLVETHLTETSFARASLQGATLDRAEGDGVVFRGADLSGASLRGVRFLDPDFRGADLTNADFEEADIVGGDFRGAILTGARWPRGQLRGAQFDEGVPMSSGFAPASPPDQPAVDPEGNALGQDASALTAALSDLIRAATTAGAHGDGHIDAEMRRVAGAWEQLSSWSGDDADLLAELLVQVQSQVAGAGAATVADADWKAILESLQDADEDRPPEVLADLLDLVVPGSLQRDGAPDMEQLARRLESMIRATGASRRDESQ